MGQEVAARTFTREDRQRYRRKVRACLEVFARMLAESRFEPARGSFGLEIELNLTDEAGGPPVVNAAALEASADPGFPTQPGEVNIEINIHPRLLGGGGFLGLEPDARGGPHSGGGQASRRWSTRRCSRRPLTRTSRPSSGSSTSRSTSIRVSWAGASSSIWSRTPGRASTAPRSSPRP